LETADICVTGYIILDYHMLQMTGLGLQKEFPNRNIVLPGIFVISDSPVPEAVFAIRSGAIDFSENPGSGLQVYRSCN